MARSRPDISALVVTWNSGGVLPGMLATLRRAAEGLDVELIHIDNASQDDSVALVTEMWSGQLVQRANNRNLGFAAALKQAVDLSSGEFLFMLNPDVRVDDGALHTLVKRLRNDPAFGAAGPLIRNPDGSTELVCARRSPGLLERMVEELGLGLVVKGTALDVYTYPRRSYALERDVPCLSGAAMLVRAAALEACGGVDDRFFMYFEDIDICERLRRGGFRVRFCPSARVIHISAASSPRDPSLEVWLATLSEVAMNKFFEIHRGRVAVLIHRVLVATGGALRAAFAPLVRSTALERATLRATGIARLRWAVSGKMPSGGPLAVPSGASPAPGRD